MLNRLRQNGAQALSNALAESGVGLVFGIPGVHNLVLFEALRRSGIRIIPATHEQGAAFMANGWGRATGKPGVFVTVPGPGLTNSLTPVAEALVDSTPMLGIVADVPDSKKQFQMHQIRQAPLVHPIAKCVRTVETASEIPAAVKKMLEQTTSGEPGPCILQIPSNLFWETVQPTNIRERVETDSPFSSGQLEMVVTRLKSAKRVGLLVGVGAADAANEVCALAEWLRAPVATTGSGRGVIDETHPLSLGFAWRGASIDPVNRLFAACDLVLALGVKFSQNGTQDYRLEFQCPLIHVDASPEVLGKNYETEIAICIDVRPFLVSLLEQKSLFGPRQDDDMLELICEEKERCESQSQSDMSTRLFIGNDTISPLVFFEQLRALLPSSAILVTDTGYNERLTIQNWLVHEPRTLINPSNFESMGFAIPTAIGAALALPDRKVVAVVGDGGLVMSGLELMTAVGEKINLMIIVLNNHGFGIIRKIQREFFGASTAVDVGSPDFKALAQSIHIGYQSTTDGLTALEQAIHANRPILLEIEMQHAEPNSTEQLKRRLKNDIKQGLQKFIH